MQHVRGMVRAIRMARVLALQALMDLPVVYALPTIMQIVLHSVTPRPHATATVHATTC